MMHLISLLAAWIPSVRTLSWKASYRKSINSPNFLNRLSPTDDSTSIFVMTKTVPFSRPLTSPRSVLRSLFSSRMSMARFWLLVTMIRLLTLITHKWHNNLDKNSKCVAASRSVAKAIIRSWTWTITTLLELELLNSSAWT